VKRAALLAACFSLPAGALRAVGGWMSDKFGAQRVTWWVLWVAWIALFLLSYPQTELVVKTIDGPRALGLSLSPVLFTSLLFALGVALAVGMASTFKYVGQDYPDSIGIVTGIVGLAGGLGGFLLPVLWGALLDLLRIRSSCFMLLYGVVWASLILLYFTEIRGYEFIERGGTLRVSPSQAARSRAPAAEPQT
jgi:NNP family nitrate/nitrite transporter-like MFS transporter